MRTGLYSLLRVPGSVPTACESFELLRMIQAGLKPVKVRARNGSAPRKKRINDAMSSPRKHNYPPRSESLAIVGLKRRNNDEKHTNFVLFF